VASATLPHILFYRRVARREKFNVLTVRKSLKFGRHVTIRKAKSGYVVSHCKSGKTGILGKHRTKKKALAQHRAIKASQSRRKSK